MTIILSSVQRYLSWRTFFLHAFQKGNVSLHTLFAVHRRVMDQEWVRGDETCISLHHLKQTLSGLRVSYRNGQQCLKAILLWTWIRKMQRITTCCWHMWIGFMEVIGKEENGRNEFYVSQQDQGLRSCV
jgi:hypothetical protein